jgi:hypothetical protein
MDIATTGFHRCMSDDSKRVVLRARFGVVRPWRHFFRNVFRGFVPRVGVFDLYREPNSVAVPGGATVTRVVVRRNSFEGTPIGLALRWLGEYSSRFLVTHGHDVHGSDDVVDDVIHLDGTSADARIG